MQLVGEDEKNIAESDDPGNAPHAAMQLVGEDEKNIASDVLAGIAYSVAAMQLVGEDEKNLGDSCERMAEIESPQCSSSVRTRRTRRRRRSHGPAATGRNAARR